MYPLRGTPDVAKQVAMGFALAEIVLAAVTWARLLGARRAAGTRFQLEFGSTGSRRSAPGSRSASTASRS